MPVRFISSLIWSQRRIVLWIVAILTVLVSVLFIKRGDISNYLSRYEDRNRLREEVELLKIETQRLEKKRGILEKGGYEVEKVAREQFRMSRPGEHVLYLVPPEDGNSTEAASGRSNNLSTRTSTNPPSNQTLSNRVSTATLRTKRPAPAPALP